MLSTVMLEALAYVRAHGLAEGLRLSRRLEDDASAGGAELTDGTLADSNRENSSSSSNGFVALVVLALLVLVAFLAWRLWRVSRWWRNRARSAKVLDEIEMEFVNDDMDDHVMEDIVLAGNLTRSTTAGGSRYDGALCRALCCALCSALCCALCWEQERVPAC